MHSLLITGFISTVAPHARDALHWGVFPVGLIFASIQGPGIVLAPAVGWLKDRVGSRSPTATGFFLVAPLQFVAGVAGEERFKWAPTGLVAKVIYATSMALTGCFMCLLYGVGTMEATGMLSLMLVQSPYADFFAETVDTIESSNPGIFGPRGGYSRAISVTTISWMTGSLVIPVVAGVVVEEFGYFEFQCILSASKIHSFLSGGDEAVLITHRSHLSHRRSHRRQFSQFEETYRSEFKRLRFALKVS